ncbi:MAG: hypothetical protein ACKOQO_05175, partial [Candidatus Limnocylindrus sp.]
MHTPRRSRISELTKAAEGLRSRLPAAVRIARGESAESPLDEVARRRQSLGEIGGRIVSIRRLWRELVLSTAQQLAPSELSLAQVAALYLLADGRPRVMRTAAGRRLRSPSAALVSSEMRLRRGVCI